MVTGERVDLVEYGRVAHDAGCASDVEHAHLVLAQLVVRPHRLAGEVAYGPLDLAVAGCDQVEARVAASVRAGAKLDQDRAARCAHDLGVRRTEPDAHRG